MLVICTGSVFAPLFRESLITSCQILFYTLVHPQHLAPSGVIGTWGRRRSGFVGEKGSGMFQPKREDHIKKGKGGFVRNVYRNFFWRPLY